MYKQVVIVLAIFTLESAAWNGSLRVRYGLNPFRSFFDLPRTVSDALEEGWTLRIRNDSLAYQTLVMYCPSPPTVCTLYDDTGYIAGLQVALEAARFKPVYDVEINGFSKWVTNEGTYWAITEYFASEEFYATPSATRVANRNPKTMLQSDAVYVTGTRRQLFKIPRSVKEIEAENFTKQACIPGMGLHYYWNMTKQTECTAEGILAFGAAMYDSGELTGVGFSVFGAYEETGDRKWFDYSLPVYPVLTLKAIIHDGPECMYDIQNDPGSKTLHTYFIDKPHELTCIDQLNNLG